MDNLTVEPFVDLAYLLGFLMDANGILVLWAGFDVGAKCINAYKLALTTACLVLGAWIN